MTWVAAMMAIFWPLMVVSYGVKAWPTFWPIPRIGIARRLLGREGHLQAGRSAVLAVVVGLGDQGDAGVLEGGDGRGRGVEHVLLGLGARGSVPSVSADSKLAMDRSAPASSAGTVGPRAVAGSAASRSPRVVPVGKWTSPPKARVTGLPSPVQSGSRRRSLGTGVPAWVRGPGRCGGAATCEGPLPPVNRTTPRMMAASRPRAHRNRLRRTRRDTSRGTSGGGHPGRDLAGSGRSSRSAQTGRSTGAPGPSRLWRSVLMPQHRGRPGPGRKVRARPGSGTPRRTVPAWPGGIRHGQFDMASSGQGD